MDEEICKNIKKYIQKLLLQLGFVEPLINDTPVFRVISVGVAGNSEGPDIRCNPRNHVEFWKFEENTIYNTFHGVFYYNNTKPP